MINNPLNRYLAKKSGNGHLLGCKGAVLKTPAEFSTKTNLIENLLPSALEDGRQNIDPDVEKSFQNLETLLSGPIVQHNLDKYQRLLIKREDQRKSGNPKRGSDGRLINPPKPKVLTQHLPELEHAFFEGIQGRLQNVTLIPENSLKKWFKKSENYGQKVKKKVEDYRQKIEIKEIFNNYG